MGTGPDPKEKANSGDTAKETAETGGLFAGIKKVMKWVKSKIVSLFETDNSSTAPKASHVEVPAATELKPPEVKKHSPLSPDLEAKLKDDKNKVLDDIGTLLKSETVKDQADLKILNDAKSFIVNPTENLEEITKHTTNVGHVIAGFMQEEVDSPPAIDALNRYLRALLCVNRIKYVEEELEKGNSASPDVKYAMKMADDRATVYARDYKDDTLLTATNKLQERLK